MIRRSDTTVYSNGITPEPDVYVTVKTAAGAVATIYDDTGAVMANPFQSGSDGSFAYNVPLSASGTYTEEYRLTSTGKARTTLNVLMTLDIDPDALPSTSDLSLLHGLTHTVVNITDGVTPTLTFTDVAGGLKLSAPIFNKDLLTNTGMTVPTATTRFTLRVTPSVMNSQAKLGLGFMVGSTWTTIGWHSTAAFIQSKSNSTGSVVATNVNGAVPTYSVGDALTMQFDVKATGECYVTLSKNGGARIAFGTTIPVGADVYLYMADLSSNTLAATYTLEKQVYAFAGRDVPLVDPANTAFLASQERARPTGFVTSLLPSWFKAYKRTGSRLFYSTMDLQPLLSTGDPTVFVQYVDVATGADANAGTSTSPLKTISQAMLNTRNGSRAIVLIKGGLYDFANCWASAGPTAAVLQVQSWDGAQVISSMHDSGLSWSLVSSSTYSATVAETVTGVFDALNLTADGDFSMLQLAPSLAACQAASGVTGTTSLVGGSSGTNGTYKLAFSGGGGTGAIGTFTVASGSVTSITIASPGIGFTSAPTISFSACPGLTGASATAVLGTVSSYFISGTTINVRAIDGRAPDANIRVYKRKSDSSANNNGHWSVVGGQIYLENIAFHGGLNGFLQDMNANSTAQYAYAKYCDFKYASNCGYDFLGNTLVMLQECLGAWNGVDNFHYDNNSFTPFTGCSAVEQDCISRYAGWDGQNQNNSSSSHGGSVVRIATKAGLGLYHHAQGRGVHDVQLGGAGFPLVYSWNLGITSRDSGGGMANFVVGGNATDASKMWNDSCTSSGATNDQEARSSAGVTIYDYDLVRSATDVSGPGTIAAYTP